ncbi:MAG: class I SAM-dependent RNA methyltransferase [Bryobacterales bacterium]
MSLKLEIEKLVYGGHGLGRVEGRAVLVPFVLPGEQLEVEAVRETPSLVHARPLSLSQRSEFRVTSDCPVYGECGGCQYQHIAYPQQLEYKREILRETLRRVGKVAWEGPIETISGEPWGYRNRTQLRIAKRDRKVIVGFLEAGSRRLIHASQCPINSPGLNRAHQALLEMAHQRRFPQFLNEVEFFTNETDVQLNVRGTGQPLSKTFFAWCGETIPGFSADEYIDYPAGSDMFRVDSRSFFQVNRFLTSKLAEASVEQAEGGRALDLYAGVGLMTLPLARKFGQVLAVDSSLRAVRSLQFNAERAGLDVKVVNLNVEEFLPSCEEGFDFVVADPPRAGLGPKITAELLRLRARHLALVSCDPATLARDLAALTAGGYEIAKITFVDMFPQTFHIECVVDLRC